MLMAQLKCHVQDAEIAHNYIINRSEITRNIRMLNIVIFKCPIKNTNFNIKFGNEIQKWMWKN